MQGRTVIGSLTLFSGANAAAHVSVAHATHNSALVVLSLIVAFISSCAAFAMVQINRQAATLSHRRVSLACSSMVLGLGIWAMHFIGMLAMEFPIAVSYNIGITALSIVPGMLAAFIALWSLQRMQSHSSRTWISGVVVGLGIAAMHYSGIAAMEMTAQLRFAWPMFVLSLVLGLVFSVLAFEAQRWIFSRSAASSGMAWKLLPALLMAAAIVSMHYVSIHAMSLVHTADAAHAASSSLSLQKNAQLSILIAVMAATIFLIFGLANALLRYRDLWQAVAARDARLNAMVETAPNAVVTIDEQGRIQVFNAQAQRIFGYTADEVMGCNIACLMPSPLAEQHDDHLHKHLGHPEKAITVNGREVIGKHKDGRLIPLQLSIGKANTGFGTIFVGYLQDISERKRTDAQLRIAASVFEHVREGVAIVDANHNISDANPAFLQLMEQTRATCIGRSLESLYENTDVPLDMKDLWRSLASEQYWQSESMLKRSDGSIWLQRISLSPVLNELKRPHHFIAVISDVTERAHFTDRQLHSDMHDSATGLIKPKQWLEKMGQRLKAAHKNASHLGVVLVQLIPDAATDEITGHSHVQRTALRMLAQLLEQRLRSTDSIGLSADNQLAIMLQDIKDTASFDALVEQLSQNIVQALNSLETDVATHIHIGSANNLHGPCTALELMQRAHSGMAALAAIPAAQIRIP